MKRVLAFIGAVVVAYVSAACLYTQFNLANLVEMGIEVPFGVRLSSTLHDLGSMAAIYLPVIALALLLAFCVTGLVLRWVPQLRSLGYVLSGFVAIYAIDFALSEFVASGTHGLPVTRTTAGLIGQCLAGALGGYAFVRFLPGKEKSYLEVAS